MTANAHYLGPRQTPRALRVALYVVLLVGGLVAARVATADELIVMRTDGVGVRLELEYVRDPAALKQGLMWRETLAHRHGMLFDFGSAQVVHMWMKDTLIPLDMLFFTETGKLAQIERNLNPHSISTITSVVPVRYVIEINAGEANQLGFDVGDRVLLSDVRARAHGP